MSEPILLRDASIDDVPIVARHRAAMFEAMGLTQPAAVAPLVAATEAFLRDAIPRGEYRGWLAVMAGAPDRAVAGAGVQLRRVLPFPRARPDGRIDVADGNQAIVLNVYTEPEFRRRGLARRLMHEVLAWARARKLDSLVLHAAPDGRPLYEELGFTATGEMRFPGDLG